MQTNQAYTSLLILLWDEYSINKLIRNNMSDELENGKVDTVNEETEKKGAPEYIDST